MVSQSTLNERKERHLGRTAILLLILVSRRGNDNALLEDRRPVPTHVLVRHGLVDLRQDVRERCLHIRAVQGRRLCKNYVFSSSLKILKNSVAHNF